MSYRILVLFFIVGLSVSSASFGQQSDTLRYRIETKDGNTYIGLIIERTEEIIRFETGNIGIISIPIQNVVSQEIIENLKVVEGEFWLDNPQMTRYFWSPNSFTIEKGEGYYQNVWIFVNQFTFGFTDHISFGFGLVPTFFFGAPTPVWVTPRVSFPIVEDKFAIGGGALIGTVLGEQETSYGIMFGTTTFGNRDRNFSFNLGWAYANGEVAKEPTVGLNGLIRVGPKGYFITENYIITGGGDTLVILMAGGRSLIKRVSIEYGLVYPFFPTDDFSDDVVLPWLGLTIPFRNKSRN